MPIYAYKCESCGHTKDVLQKMSDATLTVCPQCGASAFKKQLTAAGFQLKGSGWYVTDFRGGSQGAAAAGQGAETASGAAGTKTGEASPAAPSSTGPAAVGATQGTVASSPAPAPAPAPASSTGSTGKAST